MKRSWAVTLCTVVTLLPLLGACSASTRVSSRKDPDSTDKLRNIVVVSFVERALNAAFAQTFERKIRGRLAERGAKASVITVDTLGLEPDEIRRRIQEERPDHVLDIRPLRDRRSGDGALIEVEFDATVKRTSATRLLWRATVAYTLGIKQAALEEQADILAQGIVLRLVEDGLL
jgi:hypothetical protein